MVPSSAVSSLVSLDTSLVGSSADDVNVTVLGVGNLSPAHDSGPRSSDDVMNGDALDGGALKSPVGLQRVGTATKTHQSGDGKIRIPHSTLTLAPPTDYSKD